MGLWNGDKPMGGNKFCFKNPTRNVTFCSPIKFLESLPQDVMQEFSNLCIVRDKVVWESNELFHFFTVVQSRVSDDCSQLVTIRFNFFSGYHMTKVSNLLLGKWHFLGFSFKSGVLRLLNTEQVIVYGPQRLYYTLLCHLSKLSSVYQTNRPECILIDVGRLEEHL